MINRKKLFVVLLSVVLAAIVSAFLYLALLISTNATIAIGGFKLSFITGVILFYIELKDHEYWLGK